METAREDRTHAPPTRPADAGRYPVVLRRGFSRRPAPADPFLVDLSVEVRIPGPGEPAETRFERVDWTEIFGNDRPLRVEIGFGKSEFLLEVARANPEFNYVGFEYSAKRVIAFLKKRQRYGADNVRAICCNMTEILDELFAPSSVDRFFVLFPDPWPKRRHAKNRFVQTANMDVVHRILTPTGGISLRTDAPHYAEQMLAVLEAHPGFESLASSPGEFAHEPREPFRTLYEAKFIEQGRRIHYLEYSKRSS